jgi:serine/threonine-protein kinase RsbW
MTSQIEDKKLKSLVKRLKIILRETEIYALDLHKAPNHQASYRDFLLACNNCLKRVRSSEINHVELRKLVDGEYRHLLDVMKELFFKVVLGSKTDYFSIDHWKAKDPITLFFGNYFILNQYYRQLKDCIAGSFIKSYKASYKLIVDDVSPLFDIVDARYMEFPSELPKTREITKKIIHELDGNVGSFPLGILEEQIAEIIKNAIKHGNKSDPAKMIKVWFFSNKELFKIIVEDEGAGFVDLDKWNEFNSQRSEALAKGNIDEMMKYIQYRGPHSAEDDGGNSLFAALEYWDSGLVYNARKNKVAAVKSLY